MALSTVKLTWDLTDLIESGEAGSISLTPTELLTDTTDHIIVGQVARAVVFSGGTGSLAGIIGCDDAQISPPGWAYAITVTLATGQVVYSNTAFINYSNGAVQSLDELPLAQSPVTYQAYMLLPSGTPLAGEIPVATGNVNGVSTWGLTAGLQPSGDTTGVTDLANINALITLLGAGKTLLLGAGTFYVNGPVVPTSGMRIQGAKGASASGNDVGTISGTIIMPVAAWATTYNTSGVITLPASSEGTQLRDFWVYGLSTPSGSTGPAALDGICTNGAGASAVYLQNVGAVWNTGNGIAAYAGDGWHGSTCYSGNNLGHGVVAIPADSTWMNVHAQANGQSGTVGDGFFWIGANSRLIACRADLNQNGFTVNASDGGGVLDSVQMIGCATQRNNYNGLNVINSNSVGNGLRDPVIATGCSFFGDGQNGTNSPNGITGGAGGGGYAGVAVAGNNAVTMNGSNVLVGTVDVAGGCPAYAIATAVSGSGNTPPKFIQVNGGILNAVTSYLNDAANVGAGIRISPVTEQNTGQQFLGGTNYPIQTAENLGALQDLFTQPAGCMAATMPRHNATAACSAMSSGTLYLRAIGIQAGVLVSNLTMLTNTPTVKTGGTHGWYVLLDSSFKVRAVTADQTDAATVWGTAGTAYTLPFGTPYRTTYSGVYYIGIMVAESAGTMPLMTGAASPAGGISGATPVLAGTSSTGQSTPPAIGATMTTIGSNGGYQFYAYAT